MSNTARKAFCKSMSWSEHADGKTIIAHGDFGHGDPIYMAMSSRDRCNRFRCSGSGRFEELSAYADGAMCSSCPKMTGLYVGSSFAGNGMWLDMADPDQGGGGVIGMLNVGMLDILVPQGCPHADVSMGSGRNLPVGKALARFVDIADARDTSFPYSWKVYKHDHKVSLAIQYRKVHVNSDKNRIASEYYYQTIQCNVETGQTYISNIHNGNRLMKHQASTAKMDNITYTGRSPLFDAKWHDSGEEGKKVMQALEAFANAVAAELEDIGIGGGVSCSIGPDSQPDKVLSDIATLNRFPMARQEPLPALYVHLNEKARYKVNDIPRTATVADFPAALGIPVDKELEIMMSGGNGMARNVGFALAKAGCDDLEAYKYACSPSMLGSVHSVLMKLATFNSGGNAEPMSMLPIIVACSFPSGGWKRWVYDLVSLSEAMDQFQSLGDFRNDFEQFFMTDGDIPDEPSLLELINAADGGVLTRDGHWHPTVAGGADIAGANARGMAGLEWKRRKLGSEWKVSAQVPAFVFEPFSHGFSAENVVAGKNKVLTVERDGKAVAAVNIRDYFHIDRRKWTGRRQREYLSLKSDPDPDSANLGRRRELRQLMKDAVVMDWDLAGIVDFGDCRGYDADVVAAVSTWAKERGVRVTKKMKEYIDQMKKARSSVLKNGA